ncbi:DUF945 family protein [Pasteurellaceae bacterium LIM206]|nr:DUF945 family protein [Pasteurellaceae bacterium LIM206]
MRKSTLAVSVIIALGVIWTGGAWYTGKVAESEMQSQLDRLNQEAQAYAALGYEVKIGNAKLERGIFSSDHSYEVMVKSLNDSHSWVFPFEGKLYHGPLPLNRLSRFDFVPAMFSAEDKLVRNDTTQHYFAATNNNEPINAEITVSYNREMEGYANVAAGSLTLPDTENGTDTQVHWSNAKVTYQVNKNSEGKVKYAFDLLQFLTKGQNDVSVDMAFKNMQGVSEFQRTAFKHIFTGQQKGSADEFNYKLIRPETPPTSLQLKNWDFDYQSGLTDNFVDYGVRMNAQTTLNNQPLGKLGFDSKLAHLEADTVERLVANTVDSNSPLTMMSSPSWDKNC